MGLIVAFFALLSIARADVPKYDDPNDDRNMIKEGTRTDEEIAKCKALVGEYTKPAAICKEQADKSLDPKSCDDSEAIGVVNATKQLAGAAYGVGAFNVTGIGAFGGQGTSQESCKAVSKNNAGNYDTFSSVRGTCTVAKKTCEDVCGQVKAGLQKTPAICMNELASLKKQVYGLVSQCGALQKKIDRLTDQMQIVKNEERPLWENGGCMISTAAGTDVERPNNALTEAIKFDDRFGDKGLTTGQIMMKDKNYREMLGISDAQAERIINAKPETLQTDMLESYGYRPFTAPSTTPSNIDWNAAAQPVFSQRELDAMGAQYAPGVRSGAPVTAIGPADNAPSVNSVPAAAPTATPVNMAAVPMPPQNQAAAASAPVAPVNNPNSPAYDITALPQTPKYDQLPKAADPLATTGQHQAGALYGGKAPAAATAAVTDVKVDDAKIPTFESHTVGGVAPMQPLKGADSAGGGQGREFVNNDGGSNGRGPAAVRGAGAVAAGDSSSSSGSSRIRSFISSFIGGGDDKPSRPRGSDFQYGNHDEEKQAQQPNVDLRQFLPGEVQPRRAPSIAGMNPLRQKGIHGSETVLWNAMNDRYKALAPTLITEP